MFLIAVGAILKYAVTDTIAGVELATIGVILMIVGVVGLLVSLLWAKIWSRPAGPAVVDRGEDRPVVRDREIY